jgi:hypothetical protein
VIYINKNNTEHKIAVFISFSCNALFLFFIAHKAAIKITAVKPLIVAYMGGKKVRGCTSTPSLLRLTPNNAATARGIKIDKITIHLLYFFSTSD